MNLYLKNSLIIFSLLACLFLITSSSSIPHPYHVGSMEFSYNTKNKTFEITGRFFIDDMENALSERENKKLRFFDHTQKNEINNAIKNYSNEHLRLKVNNKFININYLGYEENKESVDLYFESESIIQPKKVETAVSYLYNIFDDQINIIHIIVNGERKTSKLNYPNRYLFQSF